MFQMQKILWHVKRLIISASKILWSVYKTNSTCGLIASTAIQTKPFILCIIPVIMIPFNYLVV